MKWISVHHEFLCASSTHSWMKGTVLSNSYHIMWRFWLCDHFGSKCWHLTTDMRIKSEAADQFLCYHDGVTHVDQAIQLSHHWRANSRTGLVVDVVKAEPTNHDFFFDLTLSVLSILISYCKGNHYQIHMWWDFEDSYQPCTTPTAKVWSNLVPTAGPLRLLWNALHFLPSPPL